MRPEPDMNRIVRSWLEEGTSRLPDRVLDAVLDQIPSYQQRRRSWPAWRLPRVTTPLRLAIAAIAIVVVAAVAAVKFIPSNSVGTGPSPSPTASPIALDSLRLNTPIDAGRYRVATPFRVPFTVTFAGGWDMRSLLEGDVSFRRTAPTDQAPWVNIDVVEGVFADPCRTEGGPAAAPTTVDGVVGKLTSMVGFHAGPITAIAVGGYSGKAVTITNTVNTDSAGCTGGPMLPLYTILGGQEAGTNGGATERLSILDVRGTIVIIDGESFPATPASTLVEIAPIVTSIVFEK